MGKNNRKKKPETPDEQVERAAEMLRREDGDILEIPLDAIHDAPRNANRMTAGRYDLLRQAIGRHGFVQPVLVEVADAGGYRLVDGHHRTRVARELGLTKVPAVILARGDARAVALSMNRLRGEVDLAEAAVVLDELVHDGFAVADLGLTGFSEQEVADLLASVRDDSGIDDLDGVVAPTDTSGDAAAPDPTERPFVLELHFRSRADLGAAKKALRRAAGKGGDLADGLLRLSEG